MNGCVAPGSVVTLPKSPSFADARGFAAMTAEITATAMQAFKNHRLMKIPQVTFDEPRHAHRMSLQQRKITAGHSPLLPALPVLTAASPEKVIDMTIPTLEIREPLSYEPQVLPPDAELSECLGMAVARHFAALCSPNR